MKQVALGTGIPARPVTVAHEQRAKAPETVGYARVAARDANGRPTHIALPGPLAADRVALFVGDLWAAEVLPSGELVHDPDRLDLLDALEPGVRIIAATVPSTGRVLCLNTVGAKVRGKAPQRRAAPSRTAMRSADALEHNPHEVFISGHAGKVLRVQ